MKSAIIALAASVLLTGADARSLLRRNHANAHLNRRDYGYPQPETEVCKVVTYTTWVDYKPTKPAYTKYEQSTVTVVPVPSTSECPLTTITPSYAYPVPTPDITTCEPGTYTFPAKTVTLTSTEVVCVPTSTVLPPGTHTYGYTTTVVATSTVVTCPYATTYTSEKAVYTTLTSTVIVCPTPGTYTAGGYTTTITKTKTLEYPHATTYVPGTYTHPAKTVTVTKTIEVVTCPYTPYVAPTPTPEPPKTYAPEPPKTYAPEPPKTYAPKPKPSPKPDTKSPYTPSGPLGKGKQWAMTYSQYNDDQSCKDRTAIFGDIKQIKDKGFRSIRVYAPDCDALPHISDACEEYGLKIILGVFIRYGDKDYGFTDVYKQVDTITTWKKWQLVEVILVGNEAVFGTVCSADELIGVIYGAKEKFRAAGYTGPVSTSETTQVLADNPQLCGAVDVIGVNIQSFFDGKSSSGAGKFVWSQLEYAKEICGGSKPAYCFEAGWPSGGASIADAHATPYDQKVAIESIYALDEGCLVYHAQYDDYWKPAEMHGGVEQKFGCAKLFPIGSGGY